LVDLDSNAVEEALEGMPILVLGGETHNGHNIVELYEKDFFFGANVYFRSYVQFVIGMKSYATIISALWYVQQRRLYPMNEYLFLIGEQKAYTSLRVLLLPAKIVTKTIADHRSTKSAFQNAPTGHTGFTQCRTTTIRRHEVLQDGSISRTKRDFTASTIVT
jgi:hypothetical protein